MVVVTPYLFSSLFTIACTSFNGFEHLSDFLIPRLNYIFKLTVLRFLLSKISLLKSFIRQLHFIPIILSVSNLCILSNSTRKIGPSKTAPKTASAHCTKSRKEGLLNSSAIVIHYVGMGSNVIQASKHHLKYVEALKKEFKVLAPAVWSGFVLVSSL